MSEEADMLAHDETLNAAPIERQIVERIYTAVMDQRLRPRTKLSESALCASFGVKRMPVRRALLLLASQGIVDLHSNRGAFVASPSGKEARDVFEARLALEPDIVQKVAQTASIGDLDALARHIKAEAMARQDRDRRESIRLSGEFHVRLAATTGNVVLSRIMRELVTRTSLIIGLFGTSGTSNCAEQEHVDILEALRRRDGDKAVALVRAHLMLWTAPPPASSGAMMRRRGTAGEEPQHGSGSYNRSGYREERLSGAWRG